MRRLLRLIFYLNGVLLYSIFLMWATWHVSKDGTRLPKIINKTILQVATLPSVSYHYFGDMKRGLSVLVANRLVWDTITRPFFNHNIHGKGNIQVLIPTFKDENTQEVKLIDVGSGKVKKVWQVSNEVLNNFVLREYKEENYAGTIQHPYMLKDSSILFTSLGLFRLNKLNKIELINSDFIFHHTIEAEDSGAFWVCGSMKNSRKIMNEKNDSTIVEDLIIGLNIRTGKIFHIKKISQVLLENGCNNLFRSSGRYTKDCFHINDIQPTKTYSEYWQKGDLFVSLRHLSLIFLYRPSTQKVIWLKQGPWLSQHDVDIIDENTIAVFDNNLLRTNDGEFSVKGYNSIIYYNFKTGLVSAPFDSIFHENKINTLSEGRYDILPDGRIYIDNANNGKLYIIRNGEVEWLYIDRVNKNQIKRFYWPRILINE